MDDTYIPQFVFTPMLERKKEEKGQFRYVYQREKIVEEAAGLKEILHQFPQNDGIVVAWFVADDTLTYQHAYNLTNKLEDLLEEMLDDWEVDVQFVPGNPATSVEEFVIDVEAIIHKLSLKYPLEMFAHIANYGHPALSQAIFLEGIRQFENRYCSVYWEEGELYIMPTTIRQRTDSWGKQFREFILDHDYQAALEIISDIEQTETVKGIKALLHMMVDRFNFSFREALNHLEEAKEYLGADGEDLPIILKDTRKCLEPLLSPEERVQDLARIQELFRQIDVFMEIDDTSSFLVRFYRVREAILFYLLNHLRTNADEPSERIERKGSIYNIFDQLEEKYMNWEIDGHYGAYFYIKSVNVAHALEVRNKSFLGHSRNKVDRDRLWKSYFGTKHTSVEKAKQRFMMDTAIMLRDLGVLEDENIPKLNRYLLELVSRIEEGAAVHA